MNLNLENKSALVSGSTAGIGFAIAKALLNEGARVIINGRTEAGVNEALKKIDKPGKAIGFAGDLSKADVALNLAKQHPDVDILVNNLGIFDPKPFEQIPDEDWFQFFETNVMSGVRLSRHYVGGMKKRNWGRIIFISSESAVQIPGDMVHYGTTKTAQLAVSRGLAEALACTGVTVNCVLPGPTMSRGETEFINAMAKKEGKTIEQIEKEFFEHVRPTSLIKRFATPEEVASLVAYVASPLSSATTGAALRVDGGVVKGVI